MITREHIRLAHAHVWPVFWPVLWVSLARLWATMLVAAEEGRPQILFFVNWNGTIRIGWVSDSAAERAARQPLGEGFDRTPWMRLVPLGASALWACLSERRRAVAATVRPLYCRCTATALLVHHALDPP